MYGGTHELVHEEFPSLGIEYTTVNPQDPAQWEQALRPNTKAGRPTSSHRLKNECAMPETAQNLREHCLATGRAAPGVAAKHSCSAALLRTPYLCAGTTPTRPADIQSARRALRRLCCAALQVFYVESISNPLVRVTDLMGVARFARQHGLTPVVDNTFASPVLCRPADVGFVVVHSATKFLNGHSDLLAGAVASSRDFISKACVPRAHLPGLQQCRPALSCWLAGPGSPSCSSPLCACCVLHQRPRLLADVAVSTWPQHLLWDGLQVSQKMVMYGGCLDPHACFLLNRGMATLGLRMRQQCASALAIAEMLQQHPMVHLTHLCSNRLALLCVLSSMTCRLCKPVRLQSVASRPIDPCTSPSQPTARPTVFDER